MSIFHVSNDESAVEDPLRHHASDTTGAGDAVRAEPGGDEQAVHLALAEHELVVGREALRAVHEAHDVGGLGGRHAQARVLHQRREAVPVFGEQAVVEVGGHAVQRPRRRIALVAAEHEPVALPAEVHEVVGIAELREVGRHTVDRPS